jgi:hypothetical protein
VPTLGQALHNIVNNILKPLLLLASLVPLGALGWEKTTAVDTQKLFETEWVHVFTVKSGKITRWRGFFNTAARYS